MRDRRDLRAKEEGGRLLSAYAALGTRARSSDVNCRHLTTYNAACERTIDRGINMTAI